MQKNKLNLHICGIHLLNSYKTVVSHLNSEFVSSLKCFFRLLYPFALCFKLSLLTDSNFGFYLICLHEQQNCIIMNMITDLDVSSPPFYVKYVNSSL